MYCGLPDRHIWVYWGVLSTLCVCVCVCGVTLHWMRIPLTKKTFLQRLQFCYCLCWYQIPLASFILCVFFLVGFCVFFFHVKKFAVADVGLHLFSVKRFLYSLNYSSRITNLRGISWSKKENYVCWYSSLCLLPQQILWPRDVHG